MKNFKKVSIIFVIFLTVVLILSLLFYYHIIPGRSYKAEDFNIKTIKSNVDYDNDKIDDYLDILDGAKEFVKKKPKYKSIYYDGGYPTDKYAVCTDLIWYALKNAGYDLKSLIDEDILNNKEDYKITKRDSNIDFRRVVNLNVFFKKFTEVLTTDEKKIEDWQQGDIVVYKNHIGIVSDKRNRHGISYIIHHGGQPRYEEDALTRQKIIAHYRFNLKMKENTHGSND